MGGGMLFVFLQKYSVNININNNKYTIKFLINAYPLINAPHTHAQPCTLVNSKIEINLPVAVIIHLNPMYSQNP